MSRSRGAARIEGVKAPAVEHESRYEALRYDAVGRRALVPRHGLAVLQCRGIAAWLDAWSEVQAPRWSAKRESPNQCPVPTESGAEVVGVLDDMTLGLLRKVNA